MKKLMVMILMLGMSGSVGAVEVKLLCEANGHSEIVRFDEEAQTVNGHRFDKRTHITDTEIAEVRANSSGDYLDSFYITRYDGVFHYGSSGDSYEHKGTCTSAVKKF